MPSTHEERRDYSKISADIKAFVHDELEDHERREKAWIENLLKGFPDGDIEGHRLYHEKKIQAAKAEAEFWDVAKSEALKNGISGIFSVLRWVAVLALLGLAYKLGFGPAVARLFGVAL